MPNWKKVVVSGSDATLNSLYVAGPITGSDVKINGWGSVSASLASIEAGAITQTLQDVTDNGNTTTNALNVTRTGATDAISTFKNINGLSQLQIISSGSSGTSPGVASIRFESYADPAQGKSASLIYDGKVNKDFLYLINAGGANVGISGSNVDSRLVVGGTSGSLYIGLDNTDPVITRDGSADALFFGTASYANVSATASFLPSDTNLNITSITASIAVFQSASIGYLQTITGSAKIIGDAYIILNNDTPTERYAGIIVQDSGSTQTTASFEFDGQTNDWFYEYSDDGGATTDHGVVIFGPEYNTKGSPTYLTNNRIPKSDGSHHLNDSNISDNGSIVSISTPLDITGSITGSDIKINDWGSVSASLASIEAGAITQTLQDVTDNGNTTTNDIKITGSLLRFAETGTTSNTYLGWNGLTFTDVDGQLGGGGQFTYDGSNNYQVGTDGLSNLSINTGNTTRILISSSNIPADTKVGVGAFLDPNDIQATLHVSGTFLVGSGSFGYVSSSDAYIDDWGSISASLASIEATVPTLQQVTDNGNTTGNAIIITGSQSNSLTLKTNGIAVSGSVSGPYHGKTHEVIYDTLSVLPGATTTISQLTVPYVAGFTFDYVAFVSTEGGGASAPGLNVGRAGTVKGILRGSGSFSKGFQIAETTTLDLEDQGKGTDGLQYNVVQDSTGNSNQLVAITNNDWSYTINYTLTLYNNPKYS